MCPSSLQYFSLPSTFCSLEVCEKDKGMIIPHRGLLSQYPLTAKNLGDADLNILSRGFHYAKCLFFTAFIYVFFWRNEILKLPYEGTLRQNWIKMRHLNNMVMTL